MLYLYPGLLGKFHPLYRRHRQVHQDCRPLFLTRQLGLGRVLRPLLHHLYLIQVRRHLVVPLLRFDYPLLHFHHCCPLHFHHCCPLHFHHCCPLHSRRCRH